MSLQDLMLALGDEIEDPNEETFLLFSQSIPSENLGFIDAKAQELEITVAGRDLAIKQSPGLLTSNREEGTTGAVVWKITPLFAEWIASDNNIIFNTSILNKRSKVLELGCGVSGVVAIALTPKVAHYIATDQQYVCKLLRNNIDENASKQRLPRRKAKPVDTPETGITEFIALDWESSCLTDLTKILRDRSSGSNFQGFDAVIACDCIYNEALIDPFVRKCVEACQLAAKSPNNRPTVCILGQQLRSDLVFEAWLTAFLKSFRVWRVPDELLISGLRQCSGFVIHIGILRESKSIIV